jgi:hypothetical protein
MALERFLYGGGVAVTTFGIVAVVVIQTIQVAPVAGIVGVILGAVFGLGAFAAVVLSFDNARPSIRRDVVSVAAFGYTALFVLGLSYVNVAGLRSVIDPTIVVVIAALVSVLVWVSLWGRSEPQPPDA